MDGKIMKLKLLFLGLILPLLAMGANTNVFDNVVIRKQIIVDPLGTTLPLAPVHAIFTNQVAGGIVFLGDVYGVTNTPTFVGRKARGTQAAPTAVQADDVLAAFNARGYGTTGFSATSKATMTGNSSENWTDAAQGTYLRFQTTANGTTTLSERMRIDNAGNVGIGTTTPTERLVVSGGGVAFNLTTVAATYTALTTDYLIQYRGTTASVVTNFLPAISSTVTNGFMLVIKDSQMSASVTNIVIFPSGTDTIDRSTNSIINANGGAVNLMVDGPNKNWIKW